MKKSIFAILFLAINSSSYASQVSIKNASVLKTLLESDRFGSCMIYIDKPLANVNCPSQWVTFSCDGTYQSREIAYNMFDSAQMSMALNKKINIRVDDLKKHNGYCFGYRIDVLK